jgi:hypothetical protein
MSAHGKRTRACLQLPIVELEDGWDVSDGEDAYWCPRVLLVDDPDSPNERRALLRVDMVRRSEISVGPPNG